LEPSSWWWRQKLFCENILRFSRIKLNPKIDEKIFHFQPPEGVEVIKPSPSSKIKEKAQENQKEQN